MRRCALCFVAFTCLALQISCADARKSTEPAAGANNATKRKAGVDWPKFLGPNGDSTSPEKGILTKWPAAGLPIVWSKKAGIGYAGPSISNGRLFFFARHKDKARLTCMNSETGREIWRFEYDTDYVDKFGYNGGSRCCPVVDGQRVYIYGAEGMLHCVDVKKGRMLWKVNTIKKFDVVPNFFGVGSAPIVVGNLLIVQIGGSPKGSDPDRFLKLKGNGSGVVAFNKITGKVKYKISDELASYASPVVANIGKRGQRCFVFARGGLLCFEPKSGKVDFHYPFRAKVIESVNAANPVIVGDKVLISETYGPGAELLQIHKKGYKVLWSDVKKSPRRKSLQAHWCTPIHHNGYIYGCSGRHDYNGELRCIELKTGKVMWSKRDLARTSLLKVDGHFIGLSEYGYLFLFEINPKKFRIKALVNLRPKDLREERVDDPYWFAPVLAHGLLYIRGDNRLLCMELISAKRK